MTNKSLIKHNVTMARMAHRMAMQSHRLGLPLTEEHWRDMCTDHMRQAREEKNDDPCPLFGKFAPAANSSKFDW